MAYFSSRNCRSSPPSLRRHAALRRRRENRRLRRRPDGALDAINSWVSERTKGLIPGSLQNRLDGRSLARIARGLSTRSVILSLPRFHLNTKAELKGALQKLGMPTAFSEAANFSRITTAVPLKIAFVKHAADFTVDEAGTVAPRLRSSGSSESQLRVVH